MRPAVALLIAAAALIVAAPRRSVALARLRREVGPRATEARIEPVVAAAGSAAPDSKRARRQALARRVLPVFGAGAAGFVAFGPLGLACSALPALASRLACATRERAQQRALAEALPEALEVLAEAVRSQGSLRLALGEVARAGPPPTRAAFASVCSRLDAGFDLAEATSSLATLVDAPGTEQALLAIGLHINSGGNLPASLDAVADWCRGRISVERELNAMTSQGRMSGLVVAVAPIGFAALAYATGLGGRFLIASPFGVAVLAAGLGLDMAGYAWMRRICEVKW